MKITRILFRFFTATALLWAVACEKPEANSGNGNDEGDQPSTSVTEINGTAIQEGNNLIGLVADTATGKGIADVVVSDGYSVVKTDANGVYQFEGSRYAVNVYISVPAEYQIPMDNLNQPAFYKKGISKNKVNRNDFNLTKLIEPEENFTLVAIGDPQVKAADHITRYQNETIADMKAMLNTHQATGKYNHAYAVTLGDIVHDTPNLWPDIVKTMQNVNLSSGNRNSGGYLPIFQCAGNHDHNAKSANDRAALGDFNSHYGPTDYSFNRGKVHVVVMDNIVCTTSSGSTWTYDAGFTKTQFEWLKADLAAVENKADKMLILCCHIPFRAGQASGGANVNTDKYHAETLALMREWNEAHIMIGHTHYPQNYRHIAYRTKNDLPVYEHIHGGACGGWWSCNMNVDGAPNGYSLYEIEGNHMKNWIAKSTGFDEGHQMRVYNGNQTWGSKYIYNWYQNSTGGSSSIKYTGRSFLKNAFVVSLWNDDEVNWKVELTHNGQTYKMTRASDKVPDAAVVSYFFNECGKNTDSWTKPLNHYWYVEAPGKVDPSTLSGWTVTATQTIPGSGEVNVYTSGSFQTTYNGF